jgi:hypothetical protein
MIILQCCLNANLKRSSLTHTKTYLLGTFFKYSRIVIIIQPLLFKLRINSDQIQTLKKTRDTLLPKLMSGQLRVSEFKENTV